MAHPGTIGCGCLLTAAVAHVSAAEWSVAPTFSSSIDYDSNRRLDVDARSSESALLTADVRFKRALENSEIGIEPRYTLRRFSDASFGNGDDRSLSAGLRWMRERARLEVNASIFDQSTLTTELLETGIVRGDTHQRLAQASADWKWTLTERRQLTAQLAYADVNYYGQAQRLLPGYRYPSAQIGELYIFSDQGSVTLSAFGSQLSSDTPGNDSHEAGLRVALTYDFSPRTHFDGSLGESSRLLAGVSSHGTDASIALSHDETRGTESLAYTRSLVPYGIGFLVERQQLSISGTRRLSPYLDGTISLLRVENDQRAVLLGLDRRSYASASAGLNWRPAETWTLGVQVAGIHTQGPGLAAGAVSEWRSAVTLTWTPHAHTRSW
jgi:hypothetical protein